MGSPTLQILQDLILLPPWFGMQVSKLGFGAPLQTSSTRGGRGESEGRTKLSRYTALNPRDTAGDQVFGSLPSGETRC
jgi:hypothetical protein